MRRILVVDDDPQLLQALRINLTARNYTVHVASSGEDALQRTPIYRPDLVLLDISLPGIDGVEVVLQMRRTTAVPIIMLSAHQAESDKIRALDAGADDYVSKPFGMGELLARMRAILRRDHTPPPKSIVTTSHFVLDLDNKTVQPADEKPSPHLTPIEWSILRTLTRHPNSLVTQRDILHEVWGPEYGSKTNYLRVHLAAIRKKLEPQPDRPRYFITEPGIGYRFQIPTQPPLQQPSNTGHDRETTTKV